MYNYVKLYEMYDGFCYKLLNRSIQQPILPSSINQSRKQCDLSPQTPPVTTIYTLLINRPTFLKIS